MYFFSSSGSISEVNLLNRVVALLSTVWSRGYVNPTAHTELLWSHLAFQIKITPNPLHWNWVFSLHTASQAFSQPRAIHIILANGAIIFLSVLDFSCWYAHTIFLFRYSYILLLFTVLYFMLPATTKTVRKEYTHLCWINDSLTGCSNSDSYQ